MEKLLIALIGLLIIYLIILLVKISKQKKELITREQNANKLTKLFQGLAGRTSEVLTVDLANETPVELLLAVKDSISMYYLNLIERSTFCDLTKDLYELENLIYESSKKQLLHHAFTEAALCVPMGYWVNILIDHIKNSYLSLSYSDKKFLLKADRLENFIISLCRKNSKLTQLESELERKIIKMSDNDNPKTFNKAIELLQKIKKC